MSKIEIIVSRLKAFKGWWILGITLLGLALRLFQLGEWSFWHDEALSVLLAGQPVPEIITITSADVHPPLYYLLVKLFMHFGQNEVTVRLVSALGGTASVYMLYRAGQTLFDEAVGLVGAFIFAIAPLQLFYAQEARMYTQLLFLTIFSAWCFVRALQNNGKVWWVLFAIGMMLAGYTAYFAFPVLAAMGLYVLLVDRRRERIICFLLATGAIIILFLPWVSVFLGQTRAVFETYWIARPNPLLLFTTLSAFFTSYTLPPFLIALSLAATLLIIFVTLNNVRHALKRGVDVHALLWLLLWAFTPLLGTFLISLVWPIFQLRTVLTASPALTLLIAWGVTRAPNRRLNLWLSVPALLLMVISIGNFYFNPAFAKPPWREAAQYLAGQTQSGDIIFHTSPGSYLPFLAYGQIMGHTQVEQVLLPDPVVAGQNVPSQPIVEAVGRVASAVDEVLAGHHRAWLVVGLDQSLEYQAAQKAQFDSRYHLLAESKIGGAHIFLYTLN